jgi:hypothetical protein
MKNVILIALVLSLAIVAISELVIHDILDHEHTFNTKTNQCSKSVCKVDAIGNFYICAKICHSLPKEE